MSALLQTVSLTRVYNSAAGKVVALNDANIEINSGELTIIRGRSGSGKTTLLNILGTLDEPTSGSVLFDGVNITDYSERAKNNLRRKEFAFIFQSVALMSYMTAYENIEFALRLANEKNVGDKVDEALRLVGLYERRNHTPSELSGGEQQRIALARAIIHNPRLIFADEPTAQMDTALSMKITKLFRQLVEQNKMTIVMTTHDPSLLDMADCIYTLEDGKIIDKKIKGHGGQL